MLHAGLDVSLERTSICVVDEEGRVSHEAKVGSEPEAVTRALASVGGEYAHRP